MCCRGGCGAMGVPSGERLIIKKILHMVDFNSSIILYYLSSIHLFSLCILRKSLLIRSPTLSFLPLPPVISLYIIVGDMCTCCCTIYNPI